jgi:tetratricopeptide (TPR) repeat protein/transcriptional regulator with XRE-family HTH domain
VADRFAVMVRQFRRRAGLTQEALAERSGVSVSTIRGVETGKRANPQLASVRSLAQALGLQPHEQDELLAAVSSTSTPDRPVPRQLPAAPTGFTGRAEELAALSASTAPVVVSALGGTGKTALALRWGGDNAGRFPDGQLYVNLRGFGPTAEPMQPAQAQYGFLTALGVDSIPANEDERTALYRSATAGKRLLVVLDNAADTSQVEPLLPGGSTCTVIVTSRRPLTGLIASHGAVPMQLDVLSDEDARTLLAGRIGAARVAAEPGAVDSIIRHCGGLPLALVITAARASVRPDLPLVRLVDELEAVRLDALDTDEGMSLRAVLSWSFRALGTEARTLITLLALAPGVDIGAAAVESLSPWPARRPLAELEAARLLTRSADGRYRMHDLVRLYASEQDTKGVTAALRRLVDFYLHSSLPAETSFAPAIEPIGLAEPAPGCTPIVPADAQTWFDTEHQNLLEAQRVAAEHGWHPQVWQLAWVMNTYHYRGYLMDVQRETWLRGTAAAEALGDNHLRGRAYRILGEACARLHRPDAFDILRQALAITEQGDDLNEIGHCHRSLTVAYHELMDHEHALVHATEALRLYRASGYTFRMTEACNAVGYHMASLGRYDEALPFSEQALALCREHGYPIVEASTLIGLGTLHLGAGRTEEAVTHYREGAALWGKLGYVYSEADVLGLLGDVHRDLGELDEAVALWRRAAQLLREHDHPAKATAWEERIVSVKR